MIAITAGQVALLLLCALPLIAGVWRTASESREERAWDSRLKDEKRDKELESLRAQLAEIEIRVESTESLLEASGIFDRLTEVELELGALKDNVEFLEDQ